MINENVRVIRMEQGVNITWFSWSENIPEVDSLRIFEVFIELTIGESVSPLILHFLRTQ